MVYYRRYGTYRYVNNTIVRYYFGTAVRVVT